MKVSSRSNSPLSPSSGNAVSIPAAPSSGNNNSNNGGVLSGMSPATFKIFLLIMMVLQNSSTVLVGRHTRSSVAREDLYSVNHLIFVVEIGKFFLSACLEYHETGGHVLQSLKHHVLDRPKDALKISIPALLYLFQNTLLYVALSNLSAPLFQVTYQCKLVTTALVSVLMLDRKYKFQQWVCLFCLSVGVAIVVLGENKDSSGGGNKDAAASESEKHESLMVGLISVTCACMSSALAGVYFEMVIKKPTKDAPTIIDPVTGASVPLPPPSLWMRNMQLAFYSFVIAYLQGHIEAARADPTNMQDASHKPYFHGFTASVWILVCLQAAGGLLVAAVIKYADNVLKGMATGVSIVVATAFSILFMGTTLSFQFFVGALMILCSVYVFSNPVTFNQDSVLPFSK